MGKKCRKDFCPEILENCSTKSDVLSKDAVAALALSDVVMFLDSVF